MLQYALVLLVATFVAPLAHAYHTAEIVGPDTVGRGLQDEFTLVLDEAVAYDTPFVLEVDDPTACLISASGASYGTDPHTVTVRAGRRRARFMLQALPGGTLDECVISGVTPLTVSIDDPTFRFVDLESTFRMGGLADKFHVKAGVILANGTFRTQGLTPGSSGPRSLTVNVSSSNATAGSVLDVDGIDTHADPTPETLTIVSPDFAAPRPQRLRFQPTASFVGLDQSTTVTADASGFVPGTRVITVRQTAVRLSDTSPRAVGLDLQDRFSLQLQPAPQATVTVTLSVPVGAPCLLAPNEDTIGGTTLALTFGPGRDGRGFVVQGVGGVEGDCVITAAAGGAYPPTTVLTPIPISCAGVRLEGVPRDLYQTAPPNEFLVRTGVPNERDTNLRYVQTVRPGVSGGSLPVSACVEPEGTPVLSIDGAGTNGCLTVGIPAGSARTPEATLALEPGTPGGPVLVRAAGAAGTCTVTTHAGDREVTVRATAIRLTNTVPEAVGAELQDTFTLALAPMPTSTFQVSLTVVTDGPCALADDEGTSTPAGWTLPITVVPGKSRYPFAIRGLRVASAGDECSITATTGASGWPAVTALGTIPIVTPAMRLRSLPGALWLNANPEPFAIELGVATDDDRTLRHVQTVWPDSGAAVRTVTVEACVDVPAYAVVLGATGSTTNCKAADVLEGEARTEEGALLLDPNTTPGTVHVFTTSAVVDPTAAGEQDVAIRATSFRLTDASPDAVGIGLQDTLTLLLEPAPTVSFTVDLHVAVDGPCALANDEEVTTPAAWDLPVTIDPGKSRYTFAVRGLRASTSTDACAITATTGAASWPPTTSLGTIDIVTPGMRLRGLPSALWLNEDPEPFTIEVGVAKDNNHGLRHVQTVWPDPGPTVRTITVEACVDNDTIATVLGTAGSSSTCRSATIAEGTTATADTALHLDPNTTPGTVHVFTKSDVAVPTLAGERDVLIRATTFRLTDSSPDVVGIDLQDTVTLLLQPVPSVGFTVDVSVPTTGPCALAKDEAVTTATVTTLGIPIVPGQARYPFTVRGLSASSDTNPCAITAATGQASWPPTTDLGSIEVVTPSIQLAGLPGSLWANAAHEPFTIEIGIPGGGDRRLRWVQTVRPDDSETQNSVAVEACADPTTIGEIVGGAGSAANCKSAHIFEGEAATAENALQLDPKVGGTVDVWVQSTQANATTVSGQKTVTIRPTNIRLTNGSPDLVGVDLQDTMTVKVEPRVPRDGGGSASITLSVPANGPCALAPNYTTVGSSQVTVDIAPGRTSGKFVVQGLAAGSCDIQVTNVSRPDYPYPLALDPIAIECAALRLADGPDSTYVGAPDDPFRIEIGPANRSSTTLRFEQTVRPGVSGGGVTVQACVEEPAKAGLRDGSTVVACDTATLASGTSSTAENALKFVPLVTDNEVCVQTSGTSCSVTAGRKCVGIGTLAIDIDPDTQERRVGEFLRTSYIHVKANQQVTADTPVTVESLTPDFCLVAPNYDLPPTSVIPIVLENGTIKEPFVLHGVLRGTCRIRASTATEWTEESFTVEPTAADLQGLPDTVQSTAPQNGFQVRVGVAEADESKVDFAQNASTDLDTIEVCSSAPDVATLRWEGLPAAGAACVNVVVDRNDPETDTSDLQFVPQGHGPTDVCVSEVTPIGVQTTAACQTVNVEPVELYIDRGVASIGGGLQSNQFTLRASPSSGLPPGGVLVRVATTTPSACKVSQSGTTAGGNSFDVQMTGAYGFWVQAATRSASTCTLSVTPLQQATKFVGVSNSFPIVTTYVALVNAPSSVLVNYLVGFNVKIGLPNADFSDVAVVQQVSPVTGAWPITVGLTAVPAGQEKARLETTSPVQSAQQVTVTVPVGGHDVTGSGLAIRGLAAGNTTITASGTNLGATTKATQPVVVSTGGGGGC